MPSFNDTYGGKGLKPADITAWGGSVQVTINNVNVTQFTDRETKETRNQFQLEFQEIIDKVFFLNKTNGEILAAVYGDNTDFWIGRPVVLYVKPGNTPNGVQDRIFTDVPAEMRPQPVVPGTPVPAGPTPQSMQQGVHQASPAPPQAQQAPMPPSAPVTPAAAPPGPPPPPTAAYGTPPPPPPGFDDGDPDDDIPF